MKGELVCGIFLPPEEEDVNGVVSRFLSDESGIIKKDLPQEREAYVIVTPCNGKENGQVIIKEARYGKNSTSPPSRVLILEVSNGNQKTSEDTVRLGYAEVRNGNGGKKKIAVDACLCFYTNTDPALDAILHS